MSGGPEAQRLSCFEQLSSLYARLEESLNHADTNSCGSCYLCCTSKELDQHNVTSVEVDYLEHHVGAEKLSLFIEFLGRKSGPEVCPYYQDGCTVYQHRPYSCRVFGHHRSKATELPEVCVFKGQEKIFSRGSFFQEVPEAQELTDLSRTYWPNRTRRDEAQASTLFQAAGLEADLAQALDFVAQGNYEQAVERALNYEPSDPFSQYCRALILEQAQQPGLAVSVLIDALNDTPHSADLWYRLGSAFLLTGQLPNSEKSFEKAVQLDPGFAQAWGMLGLCRLQRNELDGARVALNKAIALDGEDSRFLAYNDF